MQTTYHWKSVRMHWNNCNSVTAMHEHLRWSYTKKPRENCERVSLQISRLADFRHGLFVKGPQAALGVRVLIQTGFELGENDPLASDHGVTRPKDNTNSCFGIDFSAEMIFDEKLIFVEWYCYNNSCFSWFQSFVSEHILKNHGLLQHQL